LRALCSACLVAVSYGRAGGAGPPPRHHGPRIGRANIYGVSSLGLTTYDDPSYAVIVFPGGDVPMVGGVCTDVIIRAYRSMGVDLQLSRKPAHAQGLFGLSAQIYPRK
jgi:hypothetical protein